MAFANSDSRGALEVVAGGEEQEEAHWSAHDETTMQRREEAQMLRERLAVVDADERHLDSEWMQVPMGTTPGGGTDMTVGLVVPCVQKNIDSCELYRMLDSVAKQTEMPHKVVIVPSGMSATNGMKLENDLKLLYKGMFDSQVELKVFPLEHKAFAGESRNHGIAALNSTQVVIAMDADDEMVPVNVAMTKDILTETGAKCMLHTFAWPRQREVAFNTRDGELWRHSMHTNGSELYRLEVEANNGTVNFVPGMLAWSKTHNKEVAQGHLTCRREVFEAVQYNTSIERAAMPS